MRTTLDRRIAALEAAPETQPRLDLSELTQPQRDWLRAILEDLTAGRITQAEADAHGRLLLADASRKPLDSCSDG